MKESVLISQLKSIRGKWEPGPAIGVQSQSRWQGSDEIRLDGEPWRVAQCDSDLEMRQRLSEQSNGPLVLVTPLPTTAIGDDVRARLFRQQLLPVDPWNGLAERFKARQVDPVLRQSTALADAALDALADSEPPVAASGVLTAELVWQVILQNRLGLKTAKPDLMEFLPWVASDGAGAKWDALGATLQELLLRWLTGSLGDLGGILVRTLVDGHGSDALAVGFALGALTSDGADPRALGRLERFTGNQALASPFASQWNEAAEKWATREPDPGRIRRELARADQILETLGASDTAAESRWSPAGFQQRLATFAEGLAGGDIRKAQAAYSSVASHEGARFLEELRGRRERAEMAMRLVRWLDRSQEPASRLYDSVSRFEQDGSWVDWARYQLLGGDEPEGVSRSYRKLFDKVTEKRESENRRFGELFAASAASGSNPAGLLMIEDVLSTVVAPLAKVSPTGVLFIVMDGMSVPVWRELSGDLYKHGWQEWAPSEGPTFRTALTVVPSATNYSRASLLCGALVTGAQNVEKKGFQDHADLRSFKPVLFHKDDVGSSGADLSEALRLAVGKSERKIVGVVLNVIDDSLGGPEQRSFSWNLQDIPVLQTLLSEAKSSGRVVVLASDHGHVLDHGSKLNRKADSADRWRPVSDAAPSTDEVVVKGARVLVEGGRLVAPVSETIRYTANRRLGYHGGLTSQECVAPIAVLAPALMEIDGWEILPETPPDWWFEGEAVPQVERPKVKKPGKRKDPQMPVLPLFEDNRADWVSSLLASSVFTEQVATFAGRLKEDQVEKSLRVLADRNLVLLKSVFAQRLELSGLRIDGWIASLQRILNVEGYPVLSVDASQTVRLNLSLLREQFDLGESNGR